MLEQTLDSAAENGVMVYDIMTERSEINNELQRVLVGMPELFGEMEKGTPEDPAITKESVQAVTFTQCNSSSFRSAL